MTSSFDQLADQYDTLWTDSAVGRFQRQAVWRIIDPLFSPGASVLDLGCGTGVDALHLMAAGIKVCGIDASSAMVRVAQGRGVTARILPIEQLDQLAGPLDGAISNFGPLNCVSCLERVAETLARLIVPGGRLALCLMGRCCAWEICHYLSRGRPAKAFRRWRTAVESLGVRVTYPSVRRLKAVFRGKFRLDFWRGIGLLVPPSYVSLSERTLAQLAAADRRIAGLPLPRALADHRVLVFTRL
ncbi:MAG TPA: methyltransferase domain-containing protein [Bryobacteraceae bacterium]|jgi:SAM-dependent methyltransferase